MKTPYDVVIRPIISERSMDDTQLKKYTFEMTIIANLQTFLLELSRSFLFEARQKRFTLCCKFKI